MKNPIGEEFGGNNIEIYVGPREKVTNPFPELTSPPQIHTTQDLAKFLLNTDEVSIAIWRNINGIPSKLPSSNITFQN